MFAVCGGCSTVPAPSVARSNAAVPVEVFTGGDDGLTQRLADAIRSEFGRSARFTLALAPTSDLLRVTIPTNVGWKGVRGKTRVTYQLRLERAGRTVAESGGVCSEQDLRVCAKKVLEAATSAVSR